MTKRTKDELIREKLVDCFMNDLEKLLATQNGKWVVYTPSSNTPFGFYDSRTDAGANASVEFGPTEYILIRQVSEIYKKYGREGKPYGSKKRDNSKML